MSEQFELKLYDPAKAGWGSILGMLALLAVAIAGATTMPRGAWSAVWFLVVIVGGGYGGYLLLKRWAVYEAVVSVETSQLLVRRLDTDEVITIPFSGVVSYRYVAFRNTKELRFKLIDGSKEKIRANDIFGRVGDFNGLDKAVEQAAAKFQSQNPAAMAREKNFFERPISTIILVVYTTVMGLLFWLIIYHNRPLHGNLFIVVGAYVSYLAAWLAGAKRRKQE